MTPLAATEAERTLAERQKDIETTAQQHNAGRTPKFGDLMRNPWAGEGNPQRDGYFVRSKRVTGRFNPGLWYEMTDRLGKFWEMNGKAAMFVDDQAARAMQQTAEPVAELLPTMRRARNLIDTGAVAAARACLQSALDEIAAPNRAPSTDSAADALPYERRKFER